MLADRFQANFLRNGILSSPSSSKKHAGYCALSLPASSELKDVRGPGVVATVGEVIVSSDHLLRSGGELVESVESVLPPPEVVELEERIRKGTLQFERNEVQLSLRLRTELVRLSLRGR